VSEDPRALANVDRRLRDAANKALLEACRLMNLTAEVVELPIGEEIEVHCTPRIPVEGARFFLRVEVASIPKDAERRTTPPRVPVPTRLLKAWRIVPEPIGVVSIDPKTGSGRFAEVHDFLAWLDHYHTGWDRAPSVLVPLTVSLSRALPWMAKRAANAHVLFRRVVDGVEHTEVEKPATDLPASHARSQELDFDFSVACMDLLAEAGMVEEDEHREYRATKEVMQSFSSAAIHHGISARGHADPKTVEQTGLSSVVRVLLSRLPKLNESTAIRCATILSRMLPVEDTDDLMAMGEEE
jgi:hypothetical protein